MVKKYEKIYKTTESLWEQWKMQDQLSQQNDYKEDVSGDWESWYACSWQGGTINLHINRFTGPVFTRNAQTGGGANEMHLQNLRLVWVITSLGIILCHTLRRSFFVGWGMGERGFSKMVTKCLLYFAWWSNCFPLTYW